MAEDASILLEQLREELTSSGYEAVGLQAALVQAEDDGRPEDALDDLLGRLQDGVVTAMLAHAASIRLLQSRPGPRGRYWEPLPTMSASREIDPEAFVVPLDMDRADQIEELAGRLDRVLSELRFGDADQD